jgi:hypothetical protein
MSQKMRLGMFSVPVSNAIGETNFFPTKKARRDQEGAVITDPKTPKPQNPKTPVQRK